MKINGIHHVAIICSNYDVSKYFYVEVLKLEVINEVYRKERLSYKLDLKCPDGSRIELFSFPSPPKRASYPESCGLRHLAFKVSDIEAEVLDLRKHKIEAEPIRIDEFTGKRFTFIQDPDGLPIELYE